MSYKGIILDFNGTLVWDTPLHQEGWIKFCADFGMRLTEKDYLNTVHGRTTEDILSRLFDRPIMGDELYELSEKKEAAYRAACIEHPEIYRLAPGVENFLNFLHEFEIPATIATGSDPINLNFFIESLRLDKWFNTDLFLCNDGSVKNKPEPDIYVLAAEKLGLRPEQTVIVEDTYYGALSASKAGAGYLIISGPAEHHHENFNSVPGISQYISDFSQIDRNLFYKR